MLKREKIAVIADDLTGATDTGVQFTKANLVTIMMTDLEFTHSIISRADVLTVNTETRSMNSSDSFGRVHDTICKLRKYGINQFFKKVDSTLRGNPGAEIEAAMDAGNYQLAIVAPAAPRNNRLIMNGICLINGVPLKDTESGRDLITPVKTSSVLEIICEQYDGKVGLVGINIIRQGSDAVMQYTEKLYKDGFRVVVFDTETSEDLNLLAHIPFQDITRALYVGSSGLAEYIIEPSDKRCAGLKINSERIVFLIGSLMETSIMQANIAVKSGRANEIIVNVDMIFENEQQEEARVLTCFSELMKKPQHIIIRTNNSMQTQSELMSANTDITDCSEKIALFNGRITKKIISLHGISNIFTTGGDTFLKTVRTMDIKGLELKDEVLPGIPLGSAIDKETGKTLNFITKSGGFGNRDTLLGIMDYVEKN